MSAQPGPFIHPTGGEPSLSSLERPVTAAPTETLFPSESGLPRSASWVSSLLVASGGAVMAAVSLGPMAAELGNVSIWVWIVAAGVGGLQCALVAELASRFPERAGGTAQFAYRANRGGSPALGALSSWGYWFAWTPGIAVNLILAGTYLRDILWPGTSPVMIAAIIGLALYTLTTAGLTPITYVNAMLGVLAMTVILVLIAGPFIKPSAFDWNHLLPSRLPEGAPREQLAFASLLAKWMFVAVWSAYAAEIASALVSEIRDPSRHMGRVMSIAALICFFSYGAIPIALIGIVGVGGLQLDPVAIFASAGQALLGPIGQEIIGLGLAVVLIIAAETFIIGSSRAIYQMAQDGHLPRIFARINSRGAPIGSIAWDAVVIGLLLVVFGTKVVDVVAAATVGYLMVFVLMPIAYLMLRNSPGGHTDALRLPRGFVAVAVALAAFNAVVLVWGGVQWGPSVMGVGLGVSLLILPISWLTRRFDKMRRMRNDILSAP